MKSGYSDIAVVLDRSGSMADVLSDTIGGFNTFLKEQKDVKGGEATISLYQFDDQYDIVYENAKIESAEELTTKTFVPRGNTALHDAIGKTICILGERYCNMKEEDRPEKVFFVIITDGHENASKEFTFEKVSDMIKHQQSKYNWKFVFLGAELSAVQEAKILGLSSGNVLNYANNSKGISNAYLSVSNGVSRLRSCMLDEYSEADLFSQEDQIVQDQAQSKI